MSLNQRKILTTKELPELTGVSASYFEKGRLYGYGPQYIGIKSGKRSGKILYRRSDVESWLESQQRNPGSMSND